MGLRDNFKQAAKELIDGPGAPQPQGYEPPSPPEPTPVYSREPEVMPDYTPPDYMDRIPEEPREIATVIAPGTVIHGSVESECDVEVYGEVQGDIVTSRDLKLKWKVQGNATGGNVEVSGLHMVGNIVTIGAATMDSSSEVEGDVTAKSMILNGKVWGNVQVANRLTLESSAVICGHVSAEKLSVDEGAVIQGEILIGKNMLPPKRTKPVSEGRTEE